jgi:hypothetical protein
MSLPRKKRPAIRGTDREPEVFAIALRRRNINPRNQRRQRLARHLYRLGERPVLEALIAVEQGQDLDSVLLEFGLLHPSTFRALGADVLPEGGSS